MIVSDQAPLFDASTCLPFIDANGGDAFHFHSQNLGLMEFAYRKNMQDVEQDVEFLINKKKGQCDHVGSVFASKRNIDGLLSPKADKY